MAKITKNTAAPIQSLVAAIVNAVNVIAPARQRPQAKAAINSTAVRNRYIFHAPSRAGLDAMGLTVS